MSPANRKTILRIGTAGVVLLAAGALDAASRERRDVGAGAGDRSPLDHDAGGLSRGLLSRALSANEGGVLE